MADHRADKAFHRSIHTLDFAGGATRTETDSLGTKQIPAEPTPTLRILWCLGVC